MRIAIDGYDLLARHFARAVTACDDMEVGVVIERRAELANQARSAGYSVSAGKSDDCDARINGARPAAWLPGNRKQRHVLQEADNIFLDRLLNQLGGVESWMGIACTSAGSHDLSRPGGPPDRLEPIFLSRRGSVTLHRVHVPCCPTRIYYIHLMSEREWTREELERMINDSPEFLAVTASAGFGNTGLINEHFRDLGQRQGNRPEIVIWLDNLVVDRNHVYLMAEADPVSTMAGEAVTTLRRLLGLPLIHQVPRRKGADR